MTRKLICLSGSRNFCFGRAAKIISILPIGSCLLNYLAPLKDLYCGPREFNRAIRQALGAETRHERVSLLSCVGEPLKRISVRRYQAQTRCFYEISKDHLLHPSTHRGCEF
jgi:hypothetical protein